MAKQDTEVMRAAAEDTKIHGDVLASIFTYVPIVDLVPACHVYKSWNCAVSTSLRRHNKIKPWLLACTQHAITHAFDPRSRIWVRIETEPSVIIKGSSALRSSHSTLLYLLSPFELTFSFDPLHLTWHHLSLFTWRTHPVVALVGNRLIVAGGGRYFADDPLAVEMYDLEKRMWDRSDFMPEILRDTAASKWLSVTVDSDKMYVVEKNTGVAYSFYPATKVWRGPYDLRPDKSVRSSLIGFSNGRLILIGLIGNNRNNSNEMNGLKLWELNCESMEQIREMGEMPERLLESLKGESCSMFSIIFNFVGNFVFINNSSSPGKIVLCELGESGMACSWSSFDNIVANDDSFVAERLVFTCASVGLGDLHRAMTSQNCKFTTLKTISPIK